MHPYVNCLESNCFSIDEKYRLLLFFCLAFMLFTVIASLSYLLSWSHLCKTYCSHGSSGFVVNLILAPCMQTLNVCMSQ